MGKMKNFLMEVEDYFYDLLTNEGLTNDQALAFVETKYGSLGKEHCCEMIKENNFDMGDFGSPTADDWR